MRKQYLVYPVSEDALELALQTVTNFSLPDETLRLAQKIIEVYVMNDFMNKGIYNVNIMEINKVVDQLLLDHTNLELSKKGLIDVCYDDGFKFKPTKKGKEYFQKTFGSKNNN